MQHHCGVPDMNLVTVTAQTRITDPETLQLLADEIVQIAERRVDPDEPEVIVEETRREPEKPKLPRYILQRTRRVAVRDWVHTQIATPKRIVRWLSWWWLLPWKSASFVSVLLSRKVDPETLLERDTACNECDQRFYFVRLNGRASSHCAACKCPAWKMSELRYKNQKNGWKCPLRKHPGEYANDAQAEALERIGYEKNAVLSAVGGGCTGCGCGKK
jgi:hypothetical protein